MLDVVGNESYRAVGCERAQTPITVLTLDWDKGRV
jgi:hypothetical protein